MLETMIPAAILFSLAAIILAWWGPGTHIQLTSEVLHRLRRMRNPNHDQAIVVRHYSAFLYGNVAADIINFKAYGGVKNHCHNWNIQERLEKLAADDAARAFVLGYLCHLAADTIAHNHFVPYHFVYNFPPRLLGHFYWEALADAQVRDADWHTLDKLKRSKTIHQYDRLVHRAVKWRALGLRSNKWIFNNILLINCREKWRAAIRGVESNARRHPLDRGFFDRCRGASLKQMLAVFHLRRLALLKARDPTGRVALQGALRLRRELLRDHGARSRARDVSRALAQAAYAKVM
jgi:hypothetical protein